jgi:hypothetical protein
LLFSIIKDSLAAISLSYQQPALSASLHILDNPPTLAFHRCRTFVIGRNKVVERDPGFVAGEDVPDLIPRRCLFGDNFEDLLQDWIVFGGVLQDFDDRRGIRFCCWLFDFRWLNKLLRVFNSGLMCEL